MIISSLILTVLLLYILNCFQRQEIEKLHSIIKEVREYCLEKAKGRLEKTLYDDILEILDKEK